MAGPVSRERWFVGVELPSGLRDIVRVVAPRLTAGVAPQPGDRLHLTLVFLGSVLDAARADLSAALRACVEPYRPLTLELHGAGAFGRHIWLGVGGDVARLQIVWSGVIDATFRYGDSPRVHHGDDRPVLRPHVTIALAVDDASASIVAESVGDAPLARWTVAGLALYASDGGRFAVRERFPFGLPT
jgi:2'-5' RNA ligase